MQQGVSSRSSFMFIWFRKRRTSAKCDSSPSRKRDCFRWTNSSNLWMCFQVTMGSNNIANILQRHYSAFRILSHSCNENFLLYIFMLKSVTRPLGVWDKVWRTHTQFTLFLFIRLFFFRPSKAIPIKCFVSYRPPSREGGSVSVGRAKKKKKKEWTHDWILNHKQMVKDAY